MPLNSTDNFISVVEVTDSTAQQSVPYRAGQLIFSDNGHLWYDPSTGSSTESRILIDNDIYVDGVPIEDAWDNVLRYRGNASTKSLNNYTTDADYGIWRIGAGYTPTDMPVNRDSNENVLLVVTKSVGNNSTYCNQTLIYTSQNIVVTRAYDPNSEESGEWHCQTFSTPTSKTGNKFVAYSAGTMSSLEETEYSADNFLRADTTNVSGSFSSLYVDYANLDPDEIASSFNTGNYYDGRELQTTAWQPVVSNISNANCGVEGNFIINSYSAEFQGKVMLPEAFNNITYYSSSSNLFNFKIAFLINIFNDTVIRDLISLFNGNLTVQRRGAYGIRVVGKPGPNGTSLVTSDFATLNGLLAICFEGSNNSGTFILTIQPLNTSSLNPDSTQVLTIELSNPVYIGTESQDSFVLDCIESITNIYGMYLEYGNQAIQTTATEIINNLISGFNPVQSEVASIDYVEQRLDLLIPRITRITEGSDPEPPVTLGVAVDDNGNMTITGKTVTPNIDASGNLTFDGISSASVDASGNLTFIE